MNIKDKIEQQFQFMEKLIENGSTDLVNTRVSGWAVSQHLDHLLKAAERILTFIVKKEVSAKTKKNLIGRVLLFLKYIPPGRKSPRAVAGELRSSAELAESLERVRALLKSVDFNSLDKVYVDHHVFGGLNGREWLRFMTMHNRHHEKIIRRMLIG